MPLPVCPGIRAHQPAVAASRARPTAGWLFLRSDAALPSSLAPRTRGAGRRSGQGVPCWRPPAAAGGRPPPAAAAGGLQLEPRGRPHTRPRARVDRARRAARALYTAGSAARRDAPTAGSGSGAEPGGAEGAASAQRRRSVRRAAHLCAKARFDEKAVIYVALFGKAVFCARRGSRARGGGAAARSGPGRAGGARASPAREVRRA